MNRDEYINQRAAKVRRELAQDNKLGPFERRRRVKRARQEAAAELEAKATRARIERKELELCKLYEQYYRWCKTAPKPFTFVPFQSRKYRKAWEADSDVTGTSRSGRYVDIPTWTEELPDDINRAYEDRKRWLEQDLKGAVRGNDAIKIAFMLRHWEGELDFKINCVEEGISYNVAANPGAPWPPPE